jgi:hypothetical protein
VPYVLHLPVHLSPAGLVMDRKQDCSLKTPYICMLPGRLPLTRQMGKTVHFKFSLAYTVQFVRLIHLRTVVRCCVLARTNQIGLLKRLAPAAGESAGWHPCVVRLGVGGVWSPCSEMIPD